MRGIVLAPLLAAFAAAAPRPEPNAVYAKVQTQTREVVTTVYSTAASAPTPLKMIPFPVPDIDQDDLNNLKATKDASLRYAENHDDVDQEVATISSQDTENPLVQLEHTSYIKQLTCNTNSATVQFSDKKAFQTAADDWKTHAKFIIVSYDKNCGENWDESKRDYMLAKSITADKKSLTIKADISFVEFEEAFGEKATIRCELGRYHSTKKAKRGDVSGSTNFDWSSYPTNSVSRPEFSPGWELYSDDTHAVACVGCGTDGSVTVTGEFEWSFWKLEISKARVTIEGHMKGTVAVGVEASDLSASIPIADIELAQLPLSPLSIAGIVTVGPLVTVSAGASIDLEGSGEMVVGATLDWPAFKASADYFDEDAVQSEGLAPNVEPKTDFKGTLKASLDLHVPVSVGVGIDIKGIFNKQLMVVDTPGFKLGGQVSNDEASGCLGYKVDADLYNNVGLNVFDIKNVALTGWTTTMFETCFSTSTAESSTVVSSTVESTTTSSTTPVITGTGITGTGISGTASSGVPIPTPISSSAPYGNSTTITTPPSYPTGTSVGTLSTVVSGTASGPYRMY